MKPTEAKLWDAIQTLRQARLHVMHVEGEGIAALYDVGPLKKLAYYEIVKLAQKVKPPNERVTHNEG